MEQMEQMNQDTPPPKVIARPEVFDYIAKDFLRRKDPMQGGSKKCGQIKAVPVEEMKTRAKHKNTSVAETDKGS